MPSLSTCTSFRCSKRLKFVTWQSCDMHFVQVSDVKQSTKKGEIYTLVSGQSTSKGNEASLFEVKRVLNNYSRRDIMEDLCVLQVC